MAIIKNKTNKYWQGFRERGILIIESRTIISSSNSTTGHIFKRNEVSMSEAAALFTLFTIIEIQNLLRHSYTYERIKKA
jgi:hypothetical protein